MRAIHMTTVQKRALITMDHALESSPFLVNKCGAIFTPSVHQNPATDNPFVAKNQNLYFRGRCIWFDF